MMDDDLRDFYLDMGIDPSKDQWIDEEPPEPANMTVIAGYYAKELSEPEAEWTAFLISRYRSWHNAAVDYLAEKEGITDIECLQDSKYATNVLERRELFEQISEVLTSFADSATVTNVPSYVLSEGDSLMDSLRIELEQLDAVAVAVGARLGIDLNFQDFQKAAKSAAEETSAESGYSDNDVGVDCLSALRVCHVCKLAAERLQRGK